VRTREAFPIAHRDTLENLTGLYFVERRWAEARRTCLDAIAVGKDIFAAGVGDAARMEALKQTGGFYTSAAYSAVQLGRFGEGLALLEAGRARLLAEALSLSDQNLSQLTDEERRRVQACREQIRALEYEYRLPTASPDRRAEQTLTAELGAARAALRALVDELRAKYPDFMPEGLALDDLLALIPSGAALVAPLFTSQGSAVFIVPGGAREVTAEHLLLLDDFKLEDLGAIARGTLEDRGWLANYLLYRFGELTIQALFDSIDNVTRRLWDAFIGQVHERLAGLGVQRVLFMPQGDTALLPLHAAWREVDGARRCFMDDYIVSYAPSMFALAHAARSAAAGAGALVAGVSQYTQMNNLPNTRAEAESVAVLLGTAPLLDGAASVAAVREGVRGKAYVHLSCHGGFGWGGNAFDSALYLGGDEALTLAQIAAQLELDAARLVVLSACETGIVDLHNAPDEFVGLPAGFMQAGASAVVSSLWTVEDRSTALLMERLYKNLLEEGIEPVQALREAQFWLRDATAAEISAYYQQHLVPRMSQSDALQAFIDLMMHAVPQAKPYAHPFYWAAFMFSGL
jgi:CHAT domain-containing protein